MPGIKALRKIQMGWETVMGTAVASTTLWRGTGTIEDSRDIVVVNEDVGIVAPTNRIYNPKVAAALELESIEASYEQVNHVYEAGIKTVAGVADGAGTDYIYTYPLSTTAQNTLKAYTFEGGDDQQAEEMEYSLVEKFTLSGVVGEGLMVSANWFGRQVADTTYTGAISIPTVEDLIFAKTKLYLDNSGGTIGTTQVTNTLLEMNCDVVTGVIPVFAADGEKYFSTHKISGDQMSVVLSVVYEHNSDAVTEKGYFRNQTLRLLRLLTEGSAVATPGTTYSNLTHIIDLAGYYTAWSKLGERDGNDIIEAEFTALYSETDSLYGEFIVVNELSAVP